MTPSSGYVTFERAREKNANKMRNGGQHVASLIDNGRLECELCVALPNEVCNDDCHIRSNCERRNRTCADAMREKGCYCLVCPNSMLHAEAVAGTHLRVIDNANGQSNFRCSRQQRSSWQTYLYMLAAEFLSYIPLATKFVTLSTIVERVLTPALKSANPGPFCCVNWAKNASTTPSYFNV